MNGTRFGRRFSTTRTSTAGLCSAAGVAAALTAVVLLSGCSNGGGTQPSWTVQPDSPSTGAGQSAAGASPGPAAGEQVPAPTSGAATAAGWKRYTDPARKIGFDLPGDWIAQSVAPEKGTLPGALKVEVKTADGTAVATLKTGLPDQPVPGCPEPERKPYTVLSSTPVELPSNDAAAIEPRVVFRVIEGYRYFGSYGITNMVGGADGRACTLMNLVNGPEGSGNYSFGDVDFVRAFAPDEKVSPAKAFDTLEQAREYVTQGSEFSSVQRMLMSLVINTQPIEAP